MKTIKRKLLMLSGVMVILAIAGFIWVVISGWPPIIIRDSQYRKLISDFQQAQKNDKVRRSENDEHWDFAVQLPEAQTAVQVSTSHIGFGVVSIKYADEASLKPLYQYYDYSHPEEIRTSRNILYVRWQEILFRTDDWLLAYDLANRREILRRKIDPDDLEKP
jgi:hypothetical protein